MEFYVLLFIVGLLAGVGAFLMLSPVFSGSVWVGLAVFLASLYLAWKWGTRIRKKREAKRDFYYENK